MRLRSVVRRTALLAAAVLALSAPGASAAPAPSRAAAAEALREARAALISGEDVSLALRDLAAALPSLSARDRRVARAILARPTDDPPNPTDEESGADYTVAEAEPLCSPRFCIHYVETTEDAPDLTDDDTNGFPDYVDRALEVFEEVYDRENGAAPAGLGWPAAPSDGALGGGPELDVYLADIGEASLYGYVATDADQVGKSQFSYQVMDNNYTEDFFNGDESLRVTAAHEYNHVLQNGINSTLDAWVFEATATWIEEQVYPAINDYFQYLDPWAFGARDSLPLTSFVADETELNNFQYGSAVWNFYLESRFGDDAIRDVWTQSEEGEDGLTAYDRAIPLSAETSFSEAFGGLATAVAEWRSNPARFPDNASYPDVERNLFLDVDGAAAPVVLDHASFKLLDVRGAGADAIRLEATFPEDTPGTIALVGRPAGGEPVVERLVNVPAGGPATVVLDEPNAYERVTAVLVNGDRDHGEYDEDAEDWIWTGDDAAVSARVVRAPSEDVKAPETTIDSGPEGTIVETSVSFAFSADETATFACRLDGAAYEPCASPKVYTALALGEHLFEVRATDAAGNVDASPAPRRFTVGQQAAPPVIVPPGEKPPAQNPPIARDVTAPNVALKVLGKVRAGKLRLQVTCPATEAGACSGRVTLKARLGGRTVKLGSAKVTDVRGGTAKTVTVRINRPAARRLRRARRATTATVAVRVFDTAGNVSNQTVRLRVRG